MFYLFFYFFWRIAAAESLFSVLVYREGVGGLGVCVGSTLWMAPACCRKIYIAAFSRGTTLPACQSGCRVNPQSRSHSCLAWFFHHIYLQKKERHVSIWAFARSSSTNKLLQFAPCVNCCCHSYLSCLSTAVTCHWEYLVPCLTTPTALQLDLIGRPSRSASKHLKFAMFFFYVVCFGILYLSFCYGSPCWVYK